MYLKILGFVIIGIATFFFLSQTEIYYQYCKQSLETGDFLVDENLELYKKICNDHYKDYSHHYLMNNTINIFYSFMQVTSIKLLNITNKKYMKQRISQDLASLEFNLKLHKFTHTALYILLIYFAIITLPNFFFELMIYVVNKILIIFFFTFTGEAIINYVLGLNIDLLMIFYKVSDYIHLDFLVSWYRFFMKYSGLDTALTVVAEQTIGETLGHLSNATKH